MNQPPPIPKPAVVELYGKIIERGQWPTTPPTPFVAIHTLKGGVVYVHPHDIRNPK
jgi:hypothetical protein